MSIIESILKTNQVKQWEIWNCELPKRYDTSIQSGERPVLVYSNNLCNTHSPIITIIPLTSQEKKYLPTHLKVNGFGLLLESTMMAEQIQPIEKKWLKDRIGKIAEHEWQQKIHKIVDVQCGRN